MSMMNPRGMVNRSNQIGRVNEKKNRDFWSNNLPFREANGLAPDLPLQFLWPTGTEAGAYWDFGNSGYQIQAGVLLTSNSLANKVTAVGQTVGLQIDNKSQPSARSTILTPVGYGGAGAQTIAVGGNVIKFNKASSGDFVDFTPFTAAEYAGRCEVTFKLEGVVAGSVGLIVYCGGDGMTVPASLGNGTFSVQGYAGLSGLFRFHCQDANYNAKVTVLSITAHAGNHLNQATATARPVSAIETVGTWGQSVYSGRFDGVDDGMSTATFAAGTLTNNMDFFAAIKGAAIKEVLFHGGVGVGRYLGDMNSPDPNDAAGVGGAYTVFVDGTQIGGVGGTTPAILGAAATNGNWHVLEYRNLDLSAWTVAAVGGYTTYMLDAKIGPVAVCPAQSTENRDRARRIIGAQVGLLL